jgi:hypothetical protein
MMIKREDLASLMEDGGGPTAIMQLITDEQAKYDNLVNAATTLRKRYTGVLCSLEYEALLQAAEEFLPLADRLDDFETYMGTRYDEFKQLIEEVRELENETTKR